MNKHTRIAIEGSIGILKTTISKVMRGSSVKLPFKCAIAPTSELTIDKGANTGYWQCF